MRGAVAFRGRLAAGREVRAVREMAGLVEVGGMRTFRR
jgi:glycine cleavage system aminomethyltransferase T